MGWEYHNRERTKKGTWARQEKTEMLTIRCTPVEYETIRGRAYAKHMCMSEYMLDLVKRDLLLYHHGITLDGKNDV